MKTSNDNLDKIDALEARVLDLEQVNSRLVACMTRFMAIIDDRALDFTEQLTLVDERLEARIQTRAPRGFKTPIVVHSTIVENRHRNFWINHNFRTFKALDRTSQLESLLVKRGVITSQEQFDLAVAAGMLREPPPCED